MLTIFSSLRLSALGSALPGNVSQGLIWGVMALGVFITFKLLDFADLTVDGSMATGGCTTVMLILAGVNPCWAMLAAFGAGVAAGFATGLLNTKLGIPDILSGILVQLSLYSVNLRILGGKANQAISVDRYALFISSRSTGRVIGVCLIFTAVLIALMYWYFGTEQGCAIRATGCNEKMARAQGIHTEKMKVLALALSNGIVALSGGLLAQYQGFADVSMGRGSIVIGLAAVIIGEVLCKSLFRRTFSFYVRMAFIALGGVIYYIVIGIVLWLRMPTNDMKLFSAAIVAVFLAVPYLKQKRRPHIRKAARETEVNRDA
jgi:putative ABC transport system permease protein